MIEDGCGLAMTDYRLVIIELLNNLVIVVIIIFKLKHQAIYSK